MNGYGVEAVWRGKGRGDVGSGSDLVPGGESRGCGKEEAWIDTSKVLNNEDDFGRRRGRGSRAKARISGSETSFEKVLDLMYIS
jgi:hypothetical protein